MRESELWHRLNEHFGALYARSWADQVVLAELDGRTVAQALADGVVCKKIWLAVWRHEELPDSLR